MSTEKLDLAKLGPASIGAALMKINGELEKAYTTAGVADMQLVREDLSPIMAVNAPTVTPVRNRLARKPGNGPAHMWYRLDANAVPADGTLMMGTVPANGVFANGGIPAATNEAYTAVSAPYKQIGDIASVTIMDQAAGRSYRDLMAWRTKVKMMNVGMIEEWMIINGNIATNPLFFDGASILFNQNNVNAGGAQLSLRFLSTVHRQIAERGGFPRFNVMSFRMKQKLNDLILVTYFGLQQANVPGGQGFSKLYSGLNIANWDFGQGPTDLVASQCVRPSGGSAAGPEEILVFDHESMDDDGNTVEMVDLLPMSSFELARLGSTVSRALIMEISLLKVSNQFFQGKVTNIAAPVFAS